MRQFFRHHWFKCFAVLLLLSYAVASYGMRWWLESRLQTAEQLYARRQWHDVREVLTSYLHHRPGDASARLMMAEACIRDNKWLGNDKVNLALEHLARISDKDPRAAEARLQEGRLYLLLLMQPGRAEQAFLRSIRLDPARPETHLLLWKLYDFTDRWEWAEEHVWAVLDRLPHAELAARLRDWYLSEFSPGTANADLDRRLGVLGESEMPSTAIEQGRFEAIVASEPDWATGYAILARSIHRQGELQQASQYLDQAEQLPGGAETPLVIATRVAICLEQGDFDRARHAFQRWPEPHEGYDYWKTAGLISDQVIRDDEAASRYYALACQTTAGKSDWLTQHRQAQSLQRLGRSEAAAAVRQQSKTVELLMESTVQREFRKALLKPLDPATIARLVDLYQQLGRNREAAAWQGLTSSDNKATLLPSLERSSQDAHQ